MRTYPVLIFDLDNTLYDWVSYFTKSFYAMVEVAVELLVVDRNQLLDELRQVHIKYEDSEHPYSLLESATVRAKFGEDIDAARAFLDPAFHRFNSSRNANLKLYDDVKQTLNLLSASGYTLLAHTDSKFFSAFDRLNRLSIAECFEKVYCRERSNSSSLRPFDEQRWERANHDLKFVELPNNESKPDPRVVWRILEEIDCETSDALYVGDSLSHDILMACNAGVACAWAKYGTKHNVEDYERLVRVSHWSTERIKFESELRTLASGVTPTFTLDNGICEILEFLGDARELSLQAHTT